MQVVGCALLSAFSTSVAIDPAVYGYDVLCGLGCGTKYQMLYLLVPFTAEERDKAVGTGAANQTRWMGSAFGLAIATAVLNSCTSPRLEGLGLSDLNQLLLTYQQSALPTGLQDAVGCPT
ncbi:hypothetical protein B0I35DRAFT_513480, partial [Stachybotrys elegans]